jgi:hypothetical protein
MKIPLVVALVLVLSPFAAADIFDTVQQTIMGLNPFAQNQTQPSVPMPSVSAGASMSPAPAQKYASDL